MKEIILSGIVGNEITAANIRAQLPSGSEKILAKVNTPGGNVFEAFEIYNMFKEHGKKAKVQIEITGLAGSAGSYLLLSGNEPPRIHKNSSAMFHRASQGLSGNAPQLRQIADVLDSIDNIISDDLVKQTGRNKKEILEALTNDYWLIGGEAIRASGIPVEYIDDDSAEAPATEAEARAKIIATCEKIKAESGTSIKNQMDISILNKLIQNSPKEEQTLKQSFTDFIKDNPEAKADILAYATKEAPQSDPKAEAANTMKILTLSGVKISAEAEAAIVSRSTPEAYALAVLEKQSSALNASNAAALGKPKAQTEIKDQISEPDKKKAGGPEALNDADAIRALAKKQNGGK